MKQKIHNFNEWVNESALKNGDPDYLQEANKFLAEVISALEEGGLKIDPEAKREFTKNRWPGYNSDRIALDDSDGFLDGEEAFDEVADLLSFGGYKTIIYEPDSRDLLPHIIIENSHPKFTLLVTYANSSSIGGKRKTSIVFIKVLNGPSGIFSIEDFVQDEVISTIWTGDDLVEVTFEPENIEYEEKATIYYKSKKSSNGKKYKATASGPFTDYDDPIEWDEYDTLEEVK